MGQREALLCRRFVERLPLHALERAELEKLRLFFQEQHYLSDEIMRVGELTRGGAQGAVGGSQGGGLPSPSSRPGSPTASDGGRLSPSRFTRLVGQPPS